VNCSAKTEGSLDSDGQKPQKRSRPSRSQEERRTTRFLDKTCSRPSSRTKIVDKKGQRGADIERNKTARRQRWPRGRNQSSSAEERRFWKTNERGDETGGIGRRQIKGHSARISIGQNLLELGVELGRGRDHGYLAPEPKITGLLFFKPKQGGGGEGT